MRRECGSDFRSRAVYKKAIPGLQGGGLAGFRDSFQGFACHFGRGDAERDGFWQKTCCAVYQTYACLDGVARNDHRTAFNLLWYGLMQCDQFLRPLLAAVWLMASTPAMAQLVLPGASVPPTGEGVAQPRPAPPKIKPATVDGLLGKPIMQNGFRGRIVINRDKAGFSARMVLAGEKISKPNEACGIDPGGNDPVTLKPLPSTGAPLFEAAAEGCPLTFAVLEDSIIVTAPAQACIFQSADCRVDPRGLWGPAPQVLEPRTADFEKERPRADKAVRETYKEKIADASGKAEVRAIAAEQAGFSAAREMTCRNYARETVHGFCALRYTEFRGVTLQAPPPAPPPAPAAAKKPPPPKPTKPAPPATN